MTRNVAQDTTFHHFWECLAMYTQGRPGYTYHVTWMCWGERGYPTTSTHALNPRASFLAVKRNTYNLIHVWGCRDKCSQDFPAFFFCCSSAPCIILNVNRRKRRRPGNEAKANLSLQFIFTHRACVSSNSITVNTWVIITVPLSTFWEVPGNVTSHIHLAFPGPSRWGLGTRLNIQYTLLQKVGLL